MRTGCMPRPERDAALVMLSTDPRRVAAVDRWGRQGIRYQGFVTDCRNTKVTPHEAQRTTRHDGYAQDNRTHAESPGIFKVGGVFTFAARSLARKASMVTI